MRRAFLALMPIALFFTAATARAEPPRRLTNDGHLKLSPSFTSGGKEVIYSVHDVPNRVTLMRLKLSDGSRERILPSTAAHQFDSRAHTDRTRPNNQDRRITFCACH